MSVVDDPIALAPTGRGGVITIALLATLTLSLVFTLRPRSRQPPHVSELIPYVTNTFLFLTHYAELLRRAKRAFGTGNIVHFHVGPKTVYLVRGQHNIARLLRHNPALGSEGFVILVFKGMVRMLPSDLEKFINDKSGRLRTPNSGTEGTEQRYWASQHALYADFLTPAQHSDALAAQYLVALRERLPPEGTTVQLLAFMRSVVSESSLVTVFGPQMIELTPDIVDRYWAFDCKVNPLLYGAPRLLFRSAYDAQDLFYEGVERWLDYADAQRERISEGVDWEPIMGSRLCREVRKWLKRAEFSKQATVGLLGGLVFALQSNTVPIATWALIHLLQRKELYAAARDEARQAQVVNGPEEIVDIDYQKLVAMPLLQAIFVETLRLHVIFPLLREATEDVEFEGYRIPKGSYVQGAGGIEHFEEATWAKDGHGPLEFWPERHLVDAENGEVVFSMAGKTAKFFPFGGGPGMCPGRHFAKQEILLTIAALLTTFEIEFVEWTNPDGSRSDREPGNDETYAGTMPPDRDARIRLKRLG